MRYTANTRSIIFTHFFTLTPFLFPSFHPLLQTPVRVREQNKSAGTVDFSTIFSALLESGASRGTRTPNLLIRSQVFQALYLQPFQRSSIFFSHFFSHSCFFLLWPDSGLKATKWLPSCHHSRYRCNISRLLLHCYVLAGLPQSG